jgi:hypothetical protein
MKRTPPTTPTQRQWRKMIRQRKAKRRSFPVPLLGVSLVITAIVLLALFRLHPGFPEDVSGWRSSEGVRVIQGGNAWGGGGASSSTGRSNHVAGRVTHIRDGDTIEVAGVPIRFAKLDCAERGTAQGRRATSQIKSLVSGKTLSCTLTGRKSYDRWIGSCRLPDGRDFGTVMIQTGSCSRW